MRVTAVVEVDLPDSMEEDPLFVLTSMLSYASQDVKVLRVEVQGSGKLGEQLVDPDALSRGSMAAFEAGRKEASSD